VTAARKVTVLLPVHNGEPYLAAAVESILAQSFADFELLVIDDGSTDRSCEIVRAYADPRIRLLRNPGNLRLIATLNRGLQEARGEYVARMDADDVSLPGRLAAQVAYLDAHPEVGVLGSALQIIDAQGAPGEVVRFPTGHRLMQWTLCFAAPIAHPAAMMRKAVIARLGGYRAHALHCEDYDLWWRASAATQLANLDDVLLQLRKHEASITVRHAATHDETIVAVCRAALGEILRDDFTPDLIAAVMSGVRGNEAHVARAIGLLLRYARHCLSGASPGAEGEAAVRRDLVDQVLRWMDDPVGEVRTLTRLNRIQRHARAACAQALAPDDRRLVRRLAAGRAVEVVRAAAHYRASRLRAVLSSAWRAAVPRSARAHFTRIYEGNIFGSRESHSGEGSTLEQTAAIRREIPALLRELGAKSLLDAPCGDFNWLREAELGVERYIGVDIVRDLVAADQRRYGRAGREFQCRDLIRDPLPAADVILCRDCLVHLNFRDARQMLRNFRRSGSRYLLTTTFTGRGENVDLTGSMLWRTLNLQRAPFNFPAPLHLINENCTEAGGAYADKCLGLWRLEGLS
jgi:glycosyltransferase involved in cell wall biosynthesis/SAM-dependent methyltransferase